MSPNKTKPRSRFTTATVLFTAVMLLATTLRMPLRVRDLGTLVAFVDILAIITSWLGLGAGIAAIVHLILSRGSRRGWLVAFICLLLCTFVAVEFLAATCQLLSCLGGS